MTLVSLTSSYLGGTGYLAKTIKRGLFVADYIVKAQIHALQTCSNHMGGIQYYRVKKKSISPKIHLREKRDFQISKESKSHYMPKNQFDFCNSQIIDYFQILKSI